MTTALDSTVYLRLPRFDAPTAVAFGKMLREVRPQRLPPLAEKAAKRLDESVVKLEGAWRGSVRGAAREVDARPFDQRLDNLWSAVRGRLGAYSALPEERPERAQAEALDQVLFPDGLGFLKAPYVVEHTESERRLDLLETEGRGEALRALVGPVFVDELVVAHGEYGKALGITAAPEAVAPPVRVAEPLREMQAALRSYTLQLLAHAESDDEALEAVRAALRPIASMRTAIDRRASRGGGAEPGEVPAEGPVGEGDGGDDDGGEGV
ncbi:MAG: hypothetical protein MUF34_31145 [Polyangiaceae bacterium]|jgi:hypothetical protein|nr:hypothetical protein [Polyangiaceae bacterium]